MNLEVVLVPFGGLGTNKRVNCSDQEGGTARNWDCKKVLIVLESAVIVAVDRFGAHHLHRVLLPHVLLME